MVSGFHRKGGIGSMEMEKIYGTKCATCKWVEEYVNEGMVCENYGNMENTIETDECKYYEKFDDRDSPCCQCDGFRCGNCYGEDMEYDECVFGHEEGLLTKCGCREFRMREEF